MKKPKYPIVPEIVTIEGRRFEIVYDETCNQCWFYRNGYCEVITNNNIHCCTEFGFPVSYKLLGNSINDE